MADEPDLDVELEAAGRQLRAADEQRAAAMERVRAVTVRADAAGVPLAQVARKVGLSRVSVYRLLGR